MLTLLDQIAEQRVTEAMERGELDDLPGAGAPLHLEDDSLIPEHLRAGYRLLRNAGFIPPELQWRKELASVEDLLRSLPADASAERTRAQRRLQLLMSRIEARRGSGGPLWLRESGYAYRVLERLDKGD